MNRTHRITIAFLTLAFCIGAWWATARTQSAEAAHGATRLPWLTPGAELATSSNEPQKTETSLAVRANLPLKDMLEAIQQALGSAQGSTEEQKLLNAREQLRKAFPASLHAALLNLLDRYVAFHKALSSRVSSYPHDAEALRQYLELRDGLRRQYFSIEEIAAFWAAEDQADRYAQDRLRVLADHALSASEKAAALKQVEEANFSPDELAARRKSTSPHEELERTRDFNNRGVSESERFAERQRLHGTEAAQRLAELDQSERSWQQRLAQYEQTPDANKAAMAQQMFTSSELLRLDAALALRKLSP